MESKGVTTPGTMGTLESFHQTTKGLVFSPCRFSTRFCRAFLRDTIFSSPCIFLAQARDIAFRLGALPESWPCLGGAGRAAFREPMVCRKLF